MEQAPKEARNVEVRLDRLEYRYLGPAISPREPHAFIYFFTIINHSNETVTLLGRKWVVATETGEKTVVEGDGIVGETPVLEPGQSFSYNSYHTIGQNAAATGSFHGTDDAGRQIFVRIPRFDMVVPQEYETY